MERIKQVSIWFIIPEWQKWTRSDPNVIIEHCRCEWIKIEIEGRNKIKRGRNKIKRGRNKIKRGRNYKNRCKIDRKLEKIRFKNEKKLNKICCL